MENPSSLGHVAWTGLQDISAVDQTFEECLQWQLDEVLPPLAAALLISEDGVIVLCEVEACLCK